ncbi:MAG: phenylalanine--tRNA ligase subunit beta [Solirubrobacteraceae bacterium]
MLLPRFWLEDHVAPPLSTPELVEALDLSGTAVERVLRHGVGSPERFVVGSVLDAERHPDADRLTVCRVEVGEGTVQQIVCGAPNVAAGQTVAVALPGAVMPDGSTLGTASLRGVGSAGMILAEDELGIGTSHEGIIVLDGGAVPGTPLAELLPIATDVLELEITPNRPDCLGVYGVAREVHAVTGAPLGPVPWHEDPGTPGDVNGIGVVVEDPDLCPRFTARVFEDVTIGPSPEWLKARLTAAGQRPISNVVDITNYVMLLTGQPLHAFDLDRVAGGRLVVRRAREGEELATLDGDRRRLRSDMVAILDDEGPTSLAGIMGGARSEVHAGTTRVLMEVANWNGPNLHRTSQCLGLRSEASSRFEKGLSPESTLEAQAVAARLMVQLCGATLLPGTIDVGGAPSPPPPIVLRDRKLAALLGKEVPRARSAEILRALEFEVSEREDGLDARPPHFRRNDVTREADLVEEVSRVDGLENLPVTIPATRSAPGAEPRPAGLTERQRLRRRAQDALAAAGLHEILGWAFADPGVIDRLRLGADDPRREVVVLANPMSADQSVLRTMLLGSLLDAARHNTARNPGAVRLFEAGTVYLSTGAESSPSATDTAGLPSATDRAGLPREPFHVGVLLAGPARPSTWREPDPPRADVFAAKGVLGRLLDDLRASWSVKAASEPFLHPGASAAVVVQGEKVGWLGELHPLVARAWDLDQGAAGFELDLEAVCQRIEGRVERYHDVTSFPAVREDLAVTVAEHVAAGDVVGVVLRAGAPELTHAEVFDVYRGEQAGEGRTSLALALEFRAPDRTLTDEEVAQRRGAIVAALEREVGGVLRA